MNFSSIRNIDGSTSIIARNQFRVTSDVCLVFPAKALLYLLLIWYCARDNYLSEVKKTA